jgi:hypothetical protein
MSVDFAELYLRFERDEMAEFLRVWEEKGCPTVEHALGVIADID